MSGDQIWPILLGISVVLNLLLLLRRPILSWLHRDKGEELASEIMAMVEEGEESGAIEQNEKELIENIFEFNSMTADDVMIHRTDMVTLPLRADDSTILSTIQSSGLSRFPVYNEDIDDIVGILSTRDYLLNSRQKQPLPLEKLLRPAYFVPESVRADVLFRDMQNRKIHMALVVDEYGGTEGVATMEDIVEELVGEIWDEHDEVIEIFRKQPDGSYLIACSADLDDMYDLFQVKGTCDAATVSGWVMEEVGKVPEVGDHFQSEGLDVTVTKVEHRRVLEIQVRVLPHDEEPKPREWELRGREKDAGRSKRAPQKPEP